MQDSRDVRSIPFDQTKDILEGVTRQRSRWAFSVSRKPPRCQDPVIPIFTFVYNVAFYYIQRFISISSSRLKWTGHLPWNAQISKPRTTPRYMLLNLGTTCSHWSHSHHSDQNHQSFRLSIIAHSKQRICSFLSRFASDYLFTCVCQAPWPLTSTEIARWPWSPGRAPICPACSQTSSPWASCSQLRGQAEQPCGTTDHAQTSGLAPEWALLDPRVSGSATEPPGNEHCGCHAAGYRSWLIQHAARSWLKLQAAQMSTSRAPLFPIRYIANMLLSQLCLLPRKQRTDFLTILVDSLSAKCQPPSISWTVCRYLIQLTKNSSLSEMVHGHI